MSWPIDFDDDAFEPSDEELAAQKKAQEGAGRAESNMQRGRSSADDILDAVSGQETGVVRKPSECPKCGGSSKKRGPGVGPGVQERKCRKCGFTWPVGMVGERAEVLPPPPLPTILDNSGGPFHGEGGPPIDTNQPYHRRIAEHTRRARDHEP